PGVADAADDAGSRALGRALHRIHFSGQLVEGSAAGCGARRSLSSLPGSRSGLSARRRADGTHSISGAGGSAGAGRCMTVQLATISLSTATQREWDAIVVGAG